MSAPNSKVRADDAAHVLKRSHIGAALAIEQGKPRSVACRSAVLALRRCRSERSDRGRSSIVRVNN
jgi:hypothetical protein